MHLLHLLLVLHRVEASMRFFGIQLSYSTSTSLSVVGVEAILIDVGLGRALNWEQALAKRLSWNLSLSADDSLVG